MTSRHQNIAVALTVAVVTGGCASGTAAGEDDDDGGSGSGSGSGDFSFVAPIEVDSDAPPGFAMALSFDHSGLVADDKALASGDDVRVEFDDGTGPVEIDRVLEDESSWAQNPTTIRFRVQDEEGTYRLKYGDPMAESPPADPSGVYAFYENYEDGGSADEGWETTAMGSAIASDSAIAVCPPACAVNQQTGTLRFTANTGVGDFGDQSATGVDDVTFLHRSATGDFIFEVKLTGISTGLSGASRVGGAMVRETVDADAAFGAVTRRALMGTRQVLTRPTTGAAVMAMPGPDATGFPTFFRARRVAGAISFSFSDNARIWTELGGGAVVPAVTVPVGIPFANPGSGSAQSVDIDWARIRVAAPTGDPVGILGAEADL
ncbi:MAG: hypothetical protein AAF928_02305 [Myxococcota bacterium]